MSAVLRVSALNVDVCLASTSIQPYRLENGTAHFLVSDCDFDDVPGQLQDALAFLSDHAAEISQLMLNPNSAATLDFAREVRGEGFQYLAFPAVLVQRAGALGLGLEISLYPVQTP
ncbi:MAG: hypothetical protein LBE58_02100 [Comamonas sp.]|jgi:hypothetical protein|nr:hypothetical protein [Comamonas sp.]